METGTLNLGHYSSSHAQQKECQAELLVSPSTMRTERYQMKLMEVDLIKQDHLLFKGVWLETHRR